MGATCCKPDPKQTKGKKGKPSIKKDAQGLLDSVANFDHMGEGLDFSNRLEPQDGLGIEKKSYS